MKKNKFEEIKTNYDPVRESFLTEPLAKLITKNLLPSMAAMVMMGLYGIVDGILIGRRLGPGPMASVNLLFPVLALAIGLATMVGVGGNAKIAVLLGKGKISKARGVFSVVLILGIVIGLFTSLSIHLGFDRILNFLGTNAELGAYAGEYLKGFYLFFAPIILLFILERSVRTDGRPKLATGVMIFTSLLNIGLDYLFLFPLNLGLGGAAIATGISQSLGASIFLAYFIRKTLKNHQGLKIGSPKGCWSEIVGISANGSSELFSALAVGVTTLLYNRQIIEYAGTSGLAAFVIIQYFLALASQILMGMATGVQPILSYNHGGGCHERVRGTLKRVMGTGFIISLFFFLLIRFQTENLLGIFIPHDPETLALAIQVAGYISWSFLFMSIGILGSAYFTALEQALKSLTIALLRGLILIIIGLTVFPIFWGATGIWLTTLFAEGVTGIMVFVFLFKSANPVLLKAYSNRDQIYSKRLV
ncbi:MATE family efflux transporter [Halanaerobium hydrogeniformans]|uniref:Multi antimicrobial extrusion protein MatE n=1 Tax=Halanaerobium hydrogeniformans TaxID=656519 RepID=E4RNT5_HALHG|nr:MATE family efflux transporter [Halanaerobium hydrogeniformans]ADQ13763.1 multi antimicrobial extrusion protein MatE [Halanaerobium hydrogeniformans]